MQLGGNSASVLQTAVGKALEYGYREVNLNCGCPSEKVSGKGSFGAALMRDPNHVAELTSAMCAATSSSSTQSHQSKPIITVKCRIGVLDRADMATQLDADEEADYHDLATFVDTVATKGGGVEHFQVKELCTRATNSKNSHREGIKGREFFF